MEQQTDRRTFLTTACTGVGLLSGCLSTVLEDDIESVPLPTRPEEDWTQYGANSANTFASDVSAPPEANLAWTTAAFTRFRPVVADGTVFIANFNRREREEVIAIDAKDGSERWRTSVGATDFHASVIADDKVVVAYEKRLDETDPNEQGLFALDRETGDIEWRRLVPRQARDFTPVKSLTADDQTGKLILPFESGFESFQPEDGEEDWQTQATPYGSSPAIHEGTVYAFEDPDESAALVAMSLEDGTVRWRTSLGGEAPNETPVATDDGILVLIDGSLVRYDQETGERRNEIRSFDADFDPEVFGASNGTAFVMADDGITATNIETGTVQWRRDVRPESNEFAIGTDALIAGIDNPEYTPQNTSAVTAFDRTTGDVRWNYTYDRSDHMSVSPILVDGAVLFGTNHLDSLAALGDVPARE